MNPDEFKALCVILWGLHCTDDVAAFLQVSRRNALRFSEGSKAVGPDFAWKLRAELRRRLEMPGDPSPALREIRRAMA